MIDKKPNLSGGYRNKGWYLTMLEGKDKEWAYRFITDHLKAPSFVYEPQNAYAAYKETYNINFASPEEMKALLQAEEIERLKAELEAAKAPKQEVEEPIANVVHVFTKDEFKVAHPEFKGLPLHRAYQRYVKESQVK